MASRECRMQSADCRLQIVSCQATQPTEQKILYMFYNVQSQGRVEFSLYIVQNHIANYNIHISGYFYPILILLLLENTYVDTSVLSVNYGAGLPSKLRSRSATCINILKANTRQEVSLQIVLDGGCRKFNLCNN